MYYGDPLGSPEYWKASEKARRDYHKLRAKQAKRASEGLKRVYRTRNAKKKIVKNEPEKAKGNTGVRPHKATPFNPGTDSRSPKRNYGSAGNRQRKTQTHGRAVGNRNKWNS